MDQEAVNSDKAGTRDNPKNQLPVPPENQTNEIHESSQKNADEVTDSVDERTSSVDEVATVVKNSGTECVESDRLSPPQSSTKSGDETAQVQSADVAPTNEAHTSTNVGGAEVRLRPEPPGASEAADNATENPAEGSTPVETAPEVSEVVPEASTPSKSAEDLPAPPNPPPSKPAPVKEVNKTLAQPTKASKNDDPEKSSEKSTSSSKPTETDPGGTTDAKSPETHAKKPADKEVELETEEIITIEEISTNPLEIPVVDIDDETSSPAPDPKPSTSEKSKPDEASKDDKEEDKDETENTEFVPISQDKQDEDQPEGQSIEAEDPFGGADETIDMDDVGERNRSFSELGDETDNLQVVVNAQKSSPTKSTSKDAEKEPSESSKKSTEDEVVEITEVTPANFAKPSQKAPKAKKAAKEKDVEVISVDSEEQSTVLPGQDDELCIIPDDMKIVLPPRKKSDDKSAEEKEKSKAPPENSEKTSEVAEPVANNVEAAAVPEAPPPPKKAPEKRAAAPAESKEPETTPVEITDSVIDVEEEPQKVDVEEVAPAEKCKQCGEERTCKIKVKIGTEKFNVCSKSCRTAFMDAHGKATDIPSDGANSKYEKRCASCLLIVEPNDERNLSWETMEFCNEECLGKFQTKYGSYCRNCNGTVQPISLGKYCVRFGYDVRQFCCSTCLEEFKKGLKVCSYCQKDISSGSDGFLAPVGDKGQFKDFCTQACMEKYSRMNSAEPPPPERKACSVCQEEKIVFCEVQIDRGQPQAICSEPCFAAFKFVNKVDPDQCATCKKYFQVANKKSTVVFYNNEAHTFCNKSCLNIFIITNRKIVPCNWCKVKKYNFDLIRKELKSGQVVMMCSLNCLTLYQVSINAVSARRIRCDLCKEFSQAQYHLTMSDATIRNFCSYNCVMKFQAQYTKSPITIPSGEDAPVPTGMPKRTYPGKVQLQGVIKKPEMPSIANIQALTSLQNLQSKKSLPVISSVASLAPLPSNGQAPSVQKATTNVVNLNNATITNAVSTQTAPQVIYKQQVITRPPSPVDVSNKMTMCKPLTHTKGVSVRPHPCAKSTQTDEVQKVIIPIPVPIYVPFPVHMFSFPFPVPMPFPLPIPVPIFIPTTRNSTKGIFKDLKRIQEKMPSDPFEAELLMMAEMVATDKKKTESDSDSSENENEEEKTEPVDSANTFGDEMLQMALKMATGELEEPAVDLEAALTPNTITATQMPGQTEGSSEDAQPERAVTRGRKRTVSYKAKGAPNKKGRRSSSTGEVPLMPPPESQTPPSQPRPIEPIEKPDANMALKFTFGVNAWRQWVIAKNAELEKQATTAKKVKLFKTELLQLTADELNYSLCLFVKEVRKPNGAEYAPDTIYYLCLGIQQYLFENSRIDNIFTDTYYEKFTDCLNEVATKFSVLYNDAQYIVTRVEEEHLWECKQLGAHSPHVLLSTLMFFNTKHFNLVTVEEHMQLSFSHIMKHWKRNPAAQGGAVGAKAPGSRNVLLRFYPPQSALEANSRKKKVYEQQENEENPLRCPVKLYEFYLSKCPESVKTRNDVFYLLPERSCVPDSPVWYSTSPLAKEHLVKMLNRVKMVKEINVALLSS